MVQKKLAMQYMHLVHQAHLDRLVSLRGGLWEPLRAHSLCYIITLETLLSL